MYCQYECIMNESWDEHRKVLGFQQYFSNRWDNCFKSPNLSETEWQLAAVSLLVWTQDSTEGWVHSVADKVQGQSECITSRQEFTPILLFPWSKVQNQARQSVETRGRYCRSVLEGSWRWRFPGHLQTVSTMKEEEIEWMLKPT